MAHRTRGKMTPAQQELAVKHMQFSNAIADRYARKFGALLEDYRAEAYVGLCEAAESYDPGRKGGAAAFWRFAARRINGRLTSLVIARIEHRAPERAEQRNLEAYTNDVVVVSPGTCTDAFLQAMAALSPKQAVAIRAYYLGLSGLSPDEIPKNASNAWYARRRAYRQLRLRPDILRALEASAEAEE